MKNLKISYYPGCSLESVAKEYDFSVRASAQKLDIELAELPDWSCCGASSGHCTNHRLSLALPARDLARAEREGQDLVVNITSFRGIMLADEGDTETIVTRVTEEVNRTY